MQEINYYHDDNRIFNYNLILEIRRSHAGNIFEIRTSGAVHPLQNASKIDSNVYRYDIHVLHLKGGVFVDEVEIKYFLVCRRRD